MSGNEPVILPELGNMELADSQPDIYDRPIGVRLLYQNPDSGAEHYLIRYPAGLRSQRHSHTVAHTLIVLAGRLTANQQIIGSGSYCHFPARTVMHHGPVNGDCLFLAIFDGPQDVHPEGIEYL